MKPKLLVWARDRSKVRPEDAAKAAGVTVERLHEWEKGADAPTLRQLRALANKYHFPLAVFYLPEPPSDFAPLRDFRRLPEFVHETISANLAFQIRSAHERRELALELLDDLDAKPKRFHLKANLNDDPEKVGLAIRDFLDVDQESQRKAASEKRAFDFWRRKMEERDFLVFVIGGPHYSVDLKEMRGFAIAKPELPVIAVNGRDNSQGGKAFTLIHELAHIILGESAISNGAAEQLDSAPEKQRVERFCDAVAAAALMPRDLMLSLPEVSAAAGAREWSDDELRRMSRAIGVSRHALLLRFIALKQSTWDFYKTWRARFEDESRRAAEQEEKKEVKIKRWILLMSWNGRSYTRLVLRSYYDQRITLNDASSYLGAKLKNIPELERAVFQPAD